MITQRTVNKVHIISDHFAASEITLLTKRILSLSSNAHVEEIRYSNALMVVVLLCVEKKNTFAKKRNVHLFAREKCRTIVINTNSHETSHILMMSFIEVGFWWAPLKCPYVRLKNEDD